MGNGVYEKVRMKVEKGERLSEKEIVLLSILPLSESENEKRQECITRVIELAKSVRDEEDQNFILSNLWVSTSKFITREDAEKLRRELCMTELAKMFIEEGIEKGRKEGALLFVKYLKSQNMQDGDIVKVVSEQYSMNIKDVSNIIKEYNKTKK